MKKPLLLLILMLGASRVYCQLDPIYALYLNNPMTINPAYAGNNNMLNASIQYRAQWTGIAASPTTMNFNAHTSIRRNKIGLGIQIIQDQMGDSKNTEFDIVYAYKIILKRITLSFGMQSGFTRYTNAPSMLNIRDQGDDAFRVYSETKFNTGAGVILKSDKLILGISVPKLIPATVGV